MPLKAATGRVTFLRVNEVGDKFGGASDNIQAEVIIRLDTQKDAAFGFNLRNDGNRPVREGMLGLLRDAFRDRVPVTIDYQVKVGKKSGIIIRTALTKPVGSRVKPVVFVPALAPLES
jgi:hypothetical protein